MPLIDPLEQERLMTDKLSENTIYRLKVLGGMAVFAAVFAIVAAAFLIVYSPGFKEELESVLHMIDVVLLGG